MAKTVSLKYRVNIYSCGNLVLTKSLSAEDAEYFNPYDFDYWEYEDEIFDHGGYPDDCYATLDVTGKILKNCKTVDDYYDGYHDLDIPYGSKGISGFEVSKDNPFFEYVPEYKSLIFKETNEIVFVDTGHGRFKLPEGDYKLNGISFRDCRYYSPVRLPKYVTKLPEHCFHGAKISYLYIDGALEGSNRIFAGMKRVKMIVAGNTNPDIFRASFGVRVAAAKGYAKAYYDGNYDPNLVKDWNEFIEETFYMAIERHHTFKLHENVQKYIKSQDFPQSFAYKLKNLGMID